MTGQDFSSQWKKRFERYAREHGDDAGIAGWSATGLETRMRYFRRRWAATATARQTAGPWLDAGCGAGTYSRFLAGAGFEVVGMDYSEPSIVRARERSTQPVHWLVGDSTRLPIASETTGGALCLGVTQALPATDALLDELVRVCRPGAEIWVDGLNRWSLPGLYREVRRRLRRRPMHLHYVSPWAVRRDLRRRGLEDVRLTWMPILPGRTRRWQPLLEGPAVQALLHGLPPLAALLSHSFLIRGIKPRVDL